MQNKSSSCRFSGIGFAYFISFLTTVLRVCHMATPVYSWCCPQKLPRFARNGANRIYPLSAFSFFHTRRWKPSIEGHCISSFSNRECFSTTAYPVSSRLRFSLNDNDNFLRYRDLHRLKLSHPAFFPANSRFCVRLFSKNEVEADQLDEYDSEFEEAKSSQQNKWIVPSKIDIPEDQLTIKFVRSSGAGGQNVNKVSSCVQVRFHVLSAEWMGPYEVRERFTQAYKNQISKDGIFQIESQAYRTQPQNRKDVMEKLEQAVLEVWPRPKVRRVRFGLSEKGERKRKEEKTKQSSKKESRRNLKYDF